jgi:LmbE family N-acetylglucosaminyl deacetylase
MNVLVVAPHPDDESIGCGGILRQYANRLDRVVVVFLTSGELALKHLPRETAWRVREAEAQAAAEVLGVSHIDFVRGPDWFLSDHLDPAASALRNVLERERADLIFLPHPHDAHPDHRAATEVYRRAVERMDGSAPAIHGYEIWTPMSQYKYLVDITDTMHEKLRAIRSYTSQLESFRYDHAVRGLNRYRGALQSDCRYAEVFQDLTSTFDTTARTESMAGQKR